jgi:cytoskeletal protein CcmA (bactofilin family)
MDRQNWKNLSLQAMTMIGEDTIITGTIRTEGTLWIDGRVEGDVCTEGLLMVGESAVIVGNVYAGTVVSRGLIVGDIVASEEVQLLESASLNGTVRTPVFLADEGALLTDHDSEEPAYTDEEFSDGEDAWPARSVA